MFLYGLKFFQTFFRKLYFFSLKGLNYNLVGSGEEYVINYALMNLKKDNVLFFDVGANVGQYANLLLQFLPEKGIVYAFEPSLDTFRQLKDNIQDQRIKKINEGLGEEKGVLKLFRNAKESTIASAFRRTIDEQQFSDYEEVKINTIDHFCVENGIDEIDFLKIDVEGFDLHVLKGAEKMLARKKIHMIQFEFGGTQILPRIFLKDFYELLSPNFQLFRVLKDGLAPIGVYSEQIEIFAYANYLAIRK